jgi:SAM-dependent methyltransferase
MARAIYHFAFRLQLRFRCWMADHLGPADGTVPPAMLRFRVSESVSKSEFLRIGEGCADIIQRTLAQSGIPLLPSMRVLDFGCGCGRTMKWFLHRHPDVHFHGTDIDGEAVKWCQFNLGRGEYVACRTIPPLPYIDGHFDVIYCLSVFTHLNEEMQDAWLRELRRVLQPAGTLLLTVYADTASLKPADRDRLARSGFVHVKSSKLKGLVPKGYHTTWHSPAYVLDRLKPMFSQVEYILESGGSQNIVIAKGVATTVRTPTREHLT